ncbi:ATP-dependent DNA helicase [Sutcliffiella rhizosphaerae]|uniref:3'-5' exonuclease DinG n=1 Tax=Sutcliffiella rhizosphaerae TaxID=2880967 RepID=A0ABN8A5Y5_9BACI|nr:ATP-dependent DNA helicase [Sutcliffiella rhizosphaerae]CAG9620521.1 3'-5' exonuclease DinG [Sutcliffiella rhizosphaerae]
MNTILVSVRKLVEFVMMNGSIDSRFVGSNVLQEGTKTHQRIQKLRGEGYEKEVYLSLKKQVESFLLLIEGRCDGIYHTEERITIEEIKTTKRELNTITELDYPAYWAQLKMYAFMYMEENEISEIDIQMVYARRDNEDTVTFRRHYNKKQLTIFADEVIYEYLLFQKILWGFRKERDQSIGELVFPFDSFRKGQRDLSKAVYKTIQEQKVLFAKAATGIGKTMATIFPAVKSLGKGKSQKIMYLTAKNVTKTVVEDAWKRLTEKGLCMKVVSITAKEKICFQEETLCQKEFCPFADGYYDRLKEGLTDVLRNESLMTQSVVERYAKKHQLCPFEFSLDIALYTDAVICDYNYFFDPKVRLQRWSEFHEESIVLIDEAHNLVDRSRDMHSACITKSIFLQASREMKNINNDLYLQFKKINDKLLSWKKEIINNNQYVFEEKPTFLLDAVNEAVKACEQWLLTNPSQMSYQDVLTCYFEGQDFLRIGKEYDARYKTVVTLFKNDVNVKLVCLDASLSIKRLTDKTAATIFFSATLHPLGYFQRMLGSDQEDYHLSIPSPFDSDKVKVYAQPISTIYKDRGKSINPIIQSIVKTFHTKPGNYLIFFPSYEYMDMVYEEYVPYAISDGVTTIKQDRLMSEEERISFLELYSIPLNKVLIGFAVLGGVFSEGIDLKGERLTGVGIVGVGLPQLSLERNVIKEYFHTSGHNGFDFAYVYPGMNKVQQAGGRLIRTEEDEGIILLMDKRFFQESYRTLLPPEWRNFQ